MPAKVDLFGHRFGRLLVVGEAEPVGESSGRKRIRWACHCDCGREVIVRGSDLQTGRTQSCGCLHAERTVEARHVHGHASAKNGRSPEYNSWASMIARCESISNRAWHHYGGRGVRVCERWRNSFSAFLADMGPKPSRRHSIDRIDVNGNYEPGNCRWATPIRQARNTRRTRIVKFAGRELCLADACEIAGLPYSRVAQRLDKLGWSVERALSQR